MGADNFAGHDAGALYGNTLGDRRAAIGPFDAVQRIFHRRVVGRLDTGYPDLRPQRLRGDRHPGDQTAATDRHDQIVQVRDRLEHFQSDRALAGHDGRVVIGVDQSQPMLGDLVVHIAAAVVQVLASQHNRGAEFLGPADLVERCVLGHDDGRRNSQPFGMVRDPLGMIAGGHRDHAAFARAGVQTLQLDQRAAILERSRELEIFELERNAAAGQPGKRRGVDGRRVDHLAGDLCRGGADVVDVDRKPRFAHGQRSADRL